MSDKVMVEICEDLKLNYLSDLRINKHEVFLYLAKANLKNYDEKDLDDLSSYVFQEKFGNLKLRLKRYQENEHRK